MVTSIGRSLGIGEEAFKGMLAAMESQLLLKRVAVPEDIANLASFLASDDARNITGSIYVTDGGALLSPPNFNPGDMQKFGQQ